MQKTKQPEITHDFYMAKAIALAKKAFSVGEIPIGCVIVSGKKVISSGYNLTRTDRDPTAHAELVAIRKAIKSIGNERFLDTRLYVTLEPCAMCAGAIVQARIPEVIFGAWDAKAGACGSVLKVLPNRKLNHRPHVVKGVLQDECAGLLQSFFRQRRKGILKPVL